MFTHFLQRRSKLMKSKRQPLSSRLHALIIAYHRKFGDVIFKIVPLFVSVSDMNVISHIKGNRELAWSMRRFMSKLNVLLRHKTNETHSCTASRGHARV